MVALLSVLALAIAACGGGSKRASTPNPRTTAVAGSPVEGGGTPTETSSAAGHAAGATATFTSGVASGDVTATSAVLWTRAEGVDGVTAEISADASFSNARSLPATTSAARDFTVKVKADGLTPGTRYAYRFRAGDAVSPAGSFVTAPAAGTSAPLHFVFSGDSDGSRKADGTPPYNNFEVLDAAAKEQPAFFLYFGDTIYADRPPVATTLAGYRSKYRENRGYPALTNILASASTYNTWDDHEVVNDFAPPTVDSGELAAGLQAFREYLPIDDSGGVDAPMYRSFQWGSDADLILLDERSYRSAEATGPCSVDGRPDPLPGAAAPGASGVGSQGRMLLGLPADVPAGCLDALSDPSRTLLGATQKQWLKDQLTTSTATWKVIVNEVPIQQIIALPYDRWEGYAADRREILSFIRDQHIRNVVFLTTDLHGNVFGPVRVDLFDDPTPVAYEAVVGPIATATLKQEIASAISDTAANLFAPLLLSVVKADCASIDTYSYGSVDIDPAAGTLTVTARDASGAALCSKTLQAER
jgi:alkaline phosphatase D